MTKHIDQVDPLRIFKLTQNACIKMCFTKKHRFMNVFVSVGSQKSQELASVVHSIPVARVID